MSISNHWQCNCLFNSLVRVTSEPCITGLSRVIHQWPVLTKDESCRQHFQVTVTPWINTLRPRQNGRQFPRFHWTLFLSPKSPIDNKSSLVQIMAWRQIGNKPLPEPVMTHFNDAYMCVTRPRWVKDCEKACCIETEKILHNSSRLTHWGRVIHICVCNLSHHWFS